MSKELQIRNSTVGKATIRLFNDDDPLSDSASYHLIRDSRDCVVLVLHNHPSLSAFSWSDIQFLLRYETVKLMVVVTNLGNVSYLVKNSKFDFEKAVVL